MMCAMGCLPIHHSFKAVEFSVDLTHVAFSETEDSSANEARRKLTWKSALHQNPHASNCSMPTSLIQGNPVPLKKSRFINLE